MCKKLLIAVFVFFIAIAAKASNGEKITSKIKKVIVFLNGAQVTRTAMVNVNAGTSELVFGEIYPDIDAHSIQVQANGDFTILSVKHELNYLAGDNVIKQKQADDLRARQKLLRDKIDLQNSLLSIYQTEESILAKNQYVKAENASLEVAKLKEALDFQTERLISLKEKEQAIKNLVLVLNEESQRYDQQIAEINQGQSVTSSNIMVTVSSKSNLQSAFTLSYIIGNASWYPSYDIRAKNISSPLNIIYKANVSQNTGENWENVKLTLSTETPAGNAVKPELNPYYLNFYPVNDELRGRAGGVAVGYGTVKDKELAEVVIAKSVTVNQVENQTSVEFNIDNPYSILSDGKPCQVEINKVSVKAGYQYYVAPKLSTDVFLTAQITDWNQYDFLPGDANLFFEGTYVGKSRINTESFNDTLNVSLGVDKSILVKRTLEKDLSERQSIGSNKKETKSWQIDIKNHKNQKVNLLVEDQVPVSQNSSIEVELQNASGVKPDPLTGKVSWNFLLNSQEDKKVQLKYQVKYPKNQSVIVQ